MQAQRRVLNKASFCLFISVAKQLLNTTYVKANLIKITSQDFFARKWKKFLTLALNLYFQLDTEEA